MWKLGPELISSRVNSGAQASLTTQPALPLQLLTGLPITHHTKGSCPSPIQQQEGARGQGEPWEQLSQMAGSPISQGFRTKEPLEALAVLATV